MIEKIKELRSRLENVIEMQGAIVTHSDENILAIFNYLIEQHEQKEKEWKVIWDYKLKEVGRDEDLNVIKVDPVVEVGQIWRGEEDNFLVCDVGEYVTVMFEDESAGPLPIENFKSYELVTMQNIKHGEWVEHVFYKFKQQVSSNDNGEIMLVATGDLNGTIINDNFKPTLPPIAEEEKEDTEVIKIHTIWTNGADAYVTVEELDVNLGVKFYEESCGSRWIKKHS